MGYVSYISARYEMKKQRWWVVVGRVLSSWHGVFERGGGGGMSM